MLREQRGARIQRLVEALEREGWSVSWDPALITGPSYDEKIEEALDTGIDQTLMES